MRDDRSERPVRWRTRIAWLVVLWAAGVGGLAVLAALLRLAMRAAGLSG